MKKNNYLFIDGSNLYAGQYELFGPKRFLNFSNFIDQIQKKLKIKFTKIYFYTSYSPKPEKLTRTIKAYLKNEALFYRSVRSSSNIIFFTGYRSKTSGKEKEVDVKLAVDIVDFAHRNIYNQAFLLSGDADFLHALFAAQRLNKNIKVICVQNKILHKASYYFSTFIFSHKKFIYPHSTNQKIKLYKLKKKGLIKTI